MTTVATFATREASRWPSFYRGEQFDADLGLYYLRARYYNPNTGRFMSRDPEDGKIKIPASLHKYLYANGDPVNMADPRGRDAFDEYGFAIPSQVDEVASIARFGKVVLKDFECIRWALAWAAETGGDPGSAWLMYLYCMGGF